MAEREDPIVPAKDAWPIEARKQMMREVITMLADKSVLKLENAQAIAQTYTVPLACVEAEMMKHLTEGEAK